MTMMTAQSDIEFDFNNYHFAKLAVAWLKHIAWIFLLHVVIMAVKVSYHTAVVLLVYLPHCLTHQNSLDSTSLMGMNDRMFLKYEP